MGLLDRFILFLQGTMETPTTFGWFHLLWIGIVIFFIIFLYFIKNDKSDKQLKIVLFIYGFVALVFEFLKQVIWSYNYDSITNVVLWDYQWYAFPFQLCTTPIYVSLVCVFLKNSKIRDYLLSYLAYITILGGIATIIVPDSCFVSDILVNIHTMWLHCGSFVVSVYLLMSERVKLNFKSLKNGFLVFLSFVFVAFLLNFLIYNSGILNGETFNMFYISPYFVSSLPVFDIIWQSVPYFIFLIIYILAIFLGSSIIYYFSLIVRYIFGNKSN